MQHKSFATEQIRTGGVCLVQKFISGTVLLYRLLNLLCHYYILFYLPSSFLSALISSTFPTVDRFTFVFAFRIRRPGFLQRYIYLQISQIPPHFPHIIHSTVVHYTLSSTVSCSCYSMPSPGCHCFHCFTHCIISTTVL